MTSQLARRLVLVLCGITIVSSAVEASIDSLFIGTNADQINGQNTRYGFEVWVIGTGLTSVSFTPPGGPPYYLTPDGPGAWFYFDEGFVSLAALHVKYPNGTYQFAFGGTVPDSDSIPYVGPTPALPCFAAISAPLHLSTTTATPTLQWNVGCSLQPESCHYQVEEKYSEDPIFGDFFTDCPGANSVPVSPGVLQSGVAYNFWVELTAGDGGTSQLTDGGDPYTYDQGSQSSNEVWFPEPSRALMFAVGAAVVLLLSRQGRRR